jgi:hypothetical protein
VNPSSRGARVLEGNEIVDERAWHAALNGAVFDRPLLPVDFQGLARSVLLREWQGKWNSADTGRYGHSILQKVSLRPWFEGQREDRKLVSTMSKIMSGHCTVRSHLSIFRIVEGAIYIYVWKNMKQWITAMSLQKIRDQEAPSNRCTHCTRCATWDSCPGFVCFEEVVGDEGLSGFLRKSWN